MTTEYFLQEGDSQVDLARDLLDQAEHPDQVHWSPRPDVYGGGVYVLADESIAQRTREVRAARRREEADRIAEAQAAADARDSDPAVAEGLLTPAEAGFPASAVTDLSGPQDIEARQAQTDQASGEPVDETDPADESTDEPTDGQLTPAQKRAAKRAAAKQAADGNTEADESAAQKSE